MIQEMKILDFITYLSTGGAEMMLYRLLSRTDRTAFQSEVISLTDIGPVGKKIQDLGIPVLALGMGRHKPNPFYLLKLVWWMRKIKPDMIQTWMYHADLIGGLAAKLAGGIPVTWNIRHGSFDGQWIKTSTIRTAKICALLSKWLPSKIVCCAEASRKVHVQLGYAAEKMVFIPNGFDLETYHPSPVSRQNIRRILGIDETAIVIGLVGRFHAQKDHHSFIAAARLLLAERPNVRFVLCGEGIHPKNPRLTHWIEEASIEHSVYLLGHRDDIPELTSAFDIASSSSSFGEGFPTVIGEAMASGKGDIPEAKRNWVFARVVLDDRPLTLEGKRLAVGNYGVALWPNLDG